jgi:hypothetical protein
MIACAALLTLVLVPLLGVAADDLSASGHGPHREAGLRHQPSRGWRTVQAAVDRFADVPPAVLRAPLEAPPLERPVLLLVRTPFVPPRG